MMAGRFPFLLFAGGRVAAGCWARGQSELSTMGAAFNCGQVGQPKNKLSTMSTNTKGFWKKEKGGRGKAG